MRQYWVYILANIHRTLYIGVTNDLERQVFEHKNALTPGFTSKYGIDRLVYFESTNEVDVALNREKQLKGWRRGKKLALIERSNPSWKDLAASWLDVGEADPSASLRMTNNIEGDEYDT
jgi:putative endonuclease